jgi:hypothetical protein
MKVKPLTAATLPPEELAADYAAAVRVDNSAVGQKAIYLPGRVFARSKYLPLAALDRAYLRLMMGQRNHGNFRQPLLVLCCGGQEQTFLYKREQTVRALLAELQSRGVAVGKPKPPKPN